VRNLFYTGCEKRAMQTLGIYMWLMDV